MYVLLSIVVPCALLICVIWRLRSARLAWLAGFVVATCAGAAYLPSDTFSLALPGLGIPLRWADVCFFALTVAWIAIRAEHRRPAPLILTVGGMSLVLWVAWVGLQVPLAWVDDGAVKLGVPLAMRYWLYVPLGAFMLVDIFRRRTRSEAAAFMDVVGAVAVFLGVLYVCSALGLPVYPSSKLLLQQTEVGSITRGYITFCYWTVVAVPWYAAKSRMTIWSVLALAVLATTAVLSYSRGLVISLTLAGLVAAVLPAMAHGSGAKMARRFAAAVVVVALLGTLAVLVAPQNVKYVGIRFGSAFVERGATPSMQQSRVGAFASVSRSLGMQGRLTGLGFSRKGAATIEALSGRLILGDSLWTVTNAQLGFLGVTVLACCVGAFVLTGISAVRASWHSDMRIEAAMLAAIVGVAMRTFSGSEWVIGAPVASGLVLALLMASRQKAWAIDADSAESA